MRIYEIASMGGTSSGAIATVIPVTKKVDEEEGYENLDQDSKKDKEESLENTIRRR